MSVFKHCPDAVSQIRLGREKTTTTIKSLIINNELGLNTICPYRNSNNEHTQLDNTLRTWKKK